MITLYIVTMVLFTAWLTYKWITIDILNICVKIFLFLSTAFGVYIIYSEQLI